MKERMSINKAEPAIYQAMAASDKQVDSFELDARLKELIRIRVSQINGCGYCINEHTRDALKAGETTQRLFAVSAWSYLLAENIRTASRRGIESPACSQ